MTITKITTSNYYSPEANRDYWSVSQFKAFERCEAAAVAELNGLYQREKTTALLVGSYVDAYFAGELEEFRQSTPEIFNSRTGELKADYRNADALIKRLLADPVMVDYLVKGEKQKIFTAELFGAMWKIKTDVWTDERIVDLKVVRNYEPIFETGFGWRHFIEYWGYDVQGAVYQRVEQIANNRPEPLPFFIASITKESEPEPELWAFDQSALDAALGKVQALLPRFQLVKKGIIEPTRCERCEWCKRTKRINAPKIYGIEEEGE